MVYTAFRVFNAAKDKILVFRYRKTKVWSIPATHSEISPTDYIDFVSAALTLGRSFQCIGFIPILITKDSDLVWSEENSRYISMEHDFRVFDFQYQGVISPKISSESEKYFDLVTWTKQETMTTDLGFINRITKSFYLNYKSKSLINQG